MAPYASSRHIREKIKESEEYKRYRIENRMFKHVGVLHDSHFLHVLGGIRLVTAENLRLIHALFCSKRFAAGIVTSIRINKIGIGKREPRKLTFL